MIDYGNIKRSSENLQKVLHVPESLKPPVLVVCALTAIFWPALG